MSTIPDPIVSIVPGSYRFDWVDPIAVSMRYDVVRRERRSGDTTAELTVSSSITGEPELLHHARINLLSTRSQADLAKHLALRSPRLDASKWAWMVETTTHAVAVDVRSGTPPIPLSSIPEPEGGTFILPPLILNRMPTILFGDGGSAKSLVALAAALSIETGEPLLGMRPTRTGRVAYLDYEFDGYPHRDRARLLLGRESDMTYLECSTPFADDIDRIREVIRDNGIEYLIIDSIANACDGPPEDAVVATRFWQALRSLGLGSLLVAHINRAGDTERPFGSTFWHNGSRCTWYAKADSFEDQNYAMLGLYNKRLTIAARSAPLGYRIDWRPDEILFTRLGTIADVPGSSAHASTPLLIREAVRSGARTIADIAGATGIDPADIQKALARKDFAPVTGKDGITRWGLAAREERTR